MSWYQCYKNGYKRSVSDKQEAALAIHRLRRKNENGQLVTFVCFPGSLFYIPMTLRKQSGPYTPPKSK
jgi:hypothetical protein